MKRWTLLSIWTLGNVLLQAQSICQGPVYKDTALTTFFQRTQGWIAGDGAYSIPLSDKRVLWLMGDSYIDHYDSVTGTVPCLFQVRNCALLQPTGDWNWRHALRPTKDMDRNGDGAGALSFLLHTRCSSAIHQWKE